MSQDPDPYGSVGEKYRFLLQLPDKAPVLLQGPYWEQLGQDFGNSGLRLAGVNEGQLSCGFFEGGLYDLSTRFGEIGSRLEAAVVLVHHRFARPPWVHGLVSRAGNRAGLTQMVAFTPVPSLDQVEAFVAADYREAHWQSSRPRLPRPWPRARTQLLILRRPGTRSGIDVASVLLEQATGEPGYAVERFHLRRRGALVLVLASRVQRRLLRIGTNSSVLALLRRNRFISNRLKQLPELAASARELIPAQLGEADGFGVSAFAEEYRDGRLAWTAYREPAARERTEAGLYRFLHALQTATRHEAVLAGPRLDGLFGSYFEPLRNRFEGNDRVLGPLRAIEQRLRHIYDGKRRYLCLAHGDYGVGNALVSDGGEVVAVIDWDQFQEEDLPGVDWCDFKLKAEHYRAGIGDRLRSLAVAVRQAGCLAPPFGGFGRADFGLEAEDLHAIPALAVLRELSRAARFPSELQREESYYVDVLQTALTVLPA